MTPQNKDGISAAPVADPTRQMSLPPERVLVVRGQDRRRRENTLLEDEAAVLSRETSAATREDAAGIRENVVHLREAAAREHEIRAEKTILTGTDNHLMQMRQANENLVIATIKSHNLLDQIQRANSQMDYLVHHDVLTDLPNRVLLLDRLRQALELARRQSKQLAVMFMDLDHFKHINDSLGHAIGDKLLQSVANRLLACGIQTRSAARGAMNFCCCCRRLSTPKTRHC